MPVSAWSIPQASREPRIRSNPVGPGSYNPEKQQKAIPPKYSIGKQKKGLNYGSDAPGVGHYDPKGKAGRLQAEAPMYTMARKYQNDPQSIGPHDWPAKAVPGPGSYEEPREVGSGPQYSLRMKPDIDKPNQNPAPTDYNPDVNLYSLKERPVGVKIGKEVRPGLHNTNDTPGAGTYEQDQNNIKPHYKQVKFGSEARMGPNLSNMNNPGVGTYTLDADLDVGIREKKGKTLSMKFSNSPAKNVPGPGEYEAIPLESYKNDAPRFSVGKQKRGEKLNLENPGPGEYDPALEPKVNREPAFRFGTSQRQPLNDPNPYPAPDVYQIDRKVGEGPQYSLRPKPEGIKPDNTPAGTDYNPAVDFYSVKESAPSHMIGKSLRPPLNPNIETPAPCDYNQDQDPIKKSAPNRRFGTAQRMPLNQNLDVPGAGQYEIESEIDTNLKKGAGKTISAKLERPQSSYVPGPNVYNPSKEFTNPNAPRFSVGKALRDPTSPNIDKPGPGQYNPMVDGVKEKQPSIRIGTAKRSGLYENIPTPGVGTYEVRKELVERPRFHMGIKTKLQNSMFTPGAGAYNPTNKTDSTKLNITGGKIGTSKRDGWTTDRNPGPQYNQDQAIIKKNTKKGGKFSRADRSTRPSTATATAVGPGAYDIRSEIEVNLEKIKGSTIASRFFRDSHTEIPGPGTYESDLSHVKIRPQSCRFGKSQRLGENSTAENVNPGPGQYNPEHKVYKQKNPEWGFGTESKTTQINTNPTAPGQYEIKSSIGTGKSYGLGLKPKNTQQNKNPGPGTYNPSIENYSVKNSVPAVSIGKGLREEINLTNPFPGPGTYNHSKNTLNYPKYSFGKSKRPQSSLTQGPGPAYYEMADPFGSNKIEGKGPSMKMKWKNTQNDSVPGPGNYDGHDKYLKSSAPQWKIGTESRFKDGETSRSRVEVPGPGSYEQHDKLKTRASSAVRFGKARRNSLDNSTKQNPGPGQYDNTANLSQTLPKWSMRPKTKNIYEYSSDNPAPNQYTPNIENYSTKQKSTAVRIGTASRVERPQTANPGPGSYNNTGLKDKRLGKFGNADRANDQNNNVPGPGTYTLKPTFADVPGYLMAPSAKR